MNVSNANLSLNGSLNYEAKKLYSEGEIKDDHGFAFDRICCGYAVRNPEASVRDQHGRCITDDKEEFEDMIYRQVTASENGKQDLGYNLYSSEAEYLNRKNLMSTKGSFSSKVKAKLKALCDYAVSIPEKVVSYMPLFVRSTLQGLSDKLSTSDLNPFKQHFARQDLMAAIDASSATLNPKRALLLSDLHVNVFPLKEEDGPTYERIDCQPCVGNKAAVNFSDDDALDKAIDAAAKKAEQIGKVAKNKKKRLEAIDSLEQKLQNRMNDIRHRYVNDPTEVEKENQEKNKSVQRPVIEDQTADKEETACKVVNPTEEEKANQAKIQLVVRPVIEVQTAAKEEANPLVAPVA